ncbi:PA14 domain-containing protein [Flagellimonas sp. HMM57]|uniref:TIM-barrel domain-containing protein n=1 Tax=unclassified Flagellimonas TaxID=2644544 RepID=UPI0013D64213|nr:MULTISPECIES: TIM-barrel domain-containing protein [unclassified Flagellimonas]UII77670.1 PA14 domain-containing protein [Flagellimonas sp. HMM57]
MRNKLKTEIIGNKLFLLLAISCCSIASAQKFKYKKTNTGIEYAVDGNRKRIQFYSTGTVRVTTVKEGHQFTDTSLVVNSKPVTLNFDVKNRKMLRLKTKVLEVQVDQKMGAITFLDRKGKTYLQEHKTILPSLRDTTIFGESFYSVKQAFKLTEDEGLFGLGQFQDEYMNYRGEELVLAHSNKISVVPMLTSSNNYGILWDNYSRTIFKDSPGVTFFSSEVADQIDYYFIAGDDIDDVILGYRNLTGQAPLFSKKAYGFWQCKERYKTFDELHEVVQKFRTNKIPLDNIIQDWQYWGEKTKFSSMYFDPERYPNPKQNIKKLHDNNVNLMVSIWPAIGAEAELAKELDAKGYFLDQGHWSSPGSKVYDPYSKAAREVYWKHLKKGLFDNGVDGYWMDGTEPEFFSSWNQDITTEEILKVKKVALGPVSKYLNTFALLTSQGLYQKHRKATDQKRVFILTRSAWAGQQRNATVTWSGDISSNFQTLKQHVSSGVNFSLAGVPYWTHDIGGFFSKGSNGEYPKGIEDPAFHELYTRWFQFGAFTPIFRSHGTDTPREVWQFKDRNPECYDALLKVLHLRYQLMPYIYSTAWDVTDKGRTMMRGMVMDFSNDRKVFDITDQYLFGSSFLVKPITKHMYHTPETLLPIISSEYLRTPSGEAGLMGTYFDDTELNKAVYTRVDKEISFNWSGGGLPKGLQLTNFSIRWEGYLIAPESGKHTIGTIVDDGVRLWLDDKLVIDEWRPQPATLYNHEITLEKGKKYKIRMEYYQGRSSSTVNLGLEIPKQKKEKKIFDMSDKVYLPDGSGWYDFWTNEFHEGGKVVTKEYPIDIFPLYVKSGAIVPFGPKQQYVDEKPNAPIEICIYTGANGAFTYYEDEGNNYNYENGAYNTIDFTWDDKQRKLKIGKSEGAFNGHKKDKVFNIMTIDPLNGKQSNATHNYNGDAVVLQLK